VAFNITSWSKKGRNFARGEPPPPGSVEYAGVGDMAMPRPARSTSPPRGAPASVAPAPAAEVDHQNSILRAVAVGATVIGGAILVSHLACREDEPEDGNCMPIVLVPDDLPEEE